MKRPSLLGLATATLLAACRPGGPVEAPLPGLPSREPLLRVGIAVDTGEIVVGAAAPYEIALLGGDRVARAAAEERWTFTADAAGRLVGRGPGGRTIGPFEAPVQLRVREGAQPVLIAGQPYRGGAIIRASRPGRVTAINLVQLEEYLRGVVPLEIGSRPPQEIESVKAQAVAARTYAIAHLGSREAYGFDVFATIADQVYGGAAREDPVATRAVRETRGEIIAYGGRPVNAYYHSTAGGQTAAIEEAWPWREPLPYLRSVSERIPGTEDRYYDEGSNRFRWTVSWTGEQLRRILSETLAPRRAAGAPPIRRVEKVEVTGRTPSGRARALRIIADGERFVIPGDSIRWVLRPGPGLGLNSTLFVLDVARAGGEVRSLQARGRGWGHGVGMNQWGAIGRARAGQSYRRILTTYYHGSNIVRLY